MYYGLSVERSVINARGKILLQQAKADHSLEWIININSANGPMTICKFLGLTAT